VIFSGSEGSGWTWEGNIAFGGSLGPKSGATGIAVVNPQLQLDASGLWRPAPTSPATNGASGDYSTLVPNDMDGQPRIGIADVGADELSTAQIVRRPLKASDVGPQWLSGGSDPNTVGCGPAGCAFQAEDYRSILDPDNDGNVWTNLAVAGALGGQVLSAPAGDRVDAPGETHDTITVYQMQFETPGTYTAYYRTRGINSAANSIYSPAGFETNPSNLQTLSDDGSFAWIRDSQTFQIKAAHVGVPLEFRLGMREELSQIDALVISLNASLNDEMLDAIFAEVVGDFDHDADVDGDDLAIWQGSYGTNGAGDADNDGDVDGRDLLAWQRHYTGPTTLTAMIAVPEPSSTVATMLLLGWSAVGRLRP
jgi:hypothetical protein